MTSIPDLIRKNGWSLLERAYGSGIDINAVYHDGNTALHLAISNQLIDIKVVQFLIQKGININIQNEVILDNILLKAEDYMTSYPN